MSLGIEIQGGLFEALIPRNTTLPTQTSKLYTTTKDNQTSVYIQGFQGEETVADRNELLGEFELEGIPLAEAGTPEIFVDFSIDVNGLVEVSARDSMSGNSKSIQIVGSTGLSDKELEVMKGKAEGYEENAVTDDQRYAARSAANRAISRAEALLLNENVSLSAIDTIHMENAIQAVDDLLDENDSLTVDLKRATETLNDQIDSHASGIEAEAGQ
jgi:Molecular chaperone